MFIKDKANYGFSHISLALNNLEKVEKNSGLTKWLTQKSAEKPLIPPKKKEKIEAKRPNSISPLPILGSDAVLHSDDIVESSEELYICTKCGEKISCLSKQVHDDFHFALLLNRDMNSLDVLEEGKPPKKKVKKTPKILDFFTKK